MPSSRAPVLKTSSYFESLFKNTKENCILLIDTSGTITDINTAFSQSFGYTRENLIGCNLAVLFTEADRARSLPQREIAKVLSVGQASDNNFMVNKDNHLTWVSGESILVNDEQGEPVILKIIQNINTLKVTENSVIQLNNFNENILFSIEDVVIVLTKDLNIVKVNKAFYNLFGYGEAEIKKLNFAEIVRPFDSKNELLDDIQKVVNTKDGFINHNLELDSRTGEKKVFDFSCSLVENGDAEINILLTAHDITVQKQAEKEREDIIGFVAHELRNPLANIVLCNEMMTQLVLDNDTVGLGEYLQRSKSNVLRLNKMINELYDATKFNSGNFTLEKAWFDFEDMIEEALDTLEVLHPDYSIILEGECNEQVYGDRYRLIQVVTNFLSNGIKYSGKNTRVVIHIRQEAKNVIVSVKDEGLGISPKQLPHIFGRFFRAEKTRSMEGIGLGLYLCHQIIEAHHGKVWAESEEGKGSTFYFSIPYTT